MTVREVCRKAKEHSYRLANTSREERDEMLRLVADSLLDRKEEILAENAKDIADCTRPKQFIDRLRLDEKRLIGMREGILELTELPDPTVLGRPRHHELGRLARGGGGTHAPKGPCGRFDSAGRRFSYQKLR